MKYSKFRRPEFSFVWLSVLLLATVLLVSSPVIGRAAFDICGCEGHPESLGDFHSEDSSTWPAGTTINGCTGSIPLPDDGVMIFDSITLEPGSCSTNRYIRFIPNARNTPVTLLVAGDLSIGPRVWIDVRGIDGENGNSTRAGKGGDPGPGGFRGGNGVRLSVDGTGIGGAGFGPAGGAGGVDASQIAGYGLFGGNNDLRPLIGGSGGGGGYSSGDNSGGGGGGGGGALVIAANGAISLCASGSCGIYADGGVRGTYYTVGSGNGNDGSGGAIRLVSQSIQGHAYNSYLYARRGSKGKIRIEAIEDYLLCYYCDPVPVRSNVIAPVVNPVASTVEITSIGGQPVPDELTGPFGGIDLMMPAPGSTTIELATAGVPAGTTVNVNATGSVGGTVFTVTAVLNAGSCNTAGECTAFVIFDLPTGAYYLEAHATFQTP